MAEVDVAINVDRISELPKNLIESILERLSIKEAARTSILSTKWRYVWTKMAKLVLDKQFLEGLSPNKRTKSSGFVQVVDAILMLHNGPIHKFDIDIPFSKTPNMDLWILFLMRNGVKELTVYNSYPQSYKLPSYIFSYDQLTLLSLYNCDLNTPLEFTGFRNLRELYLKKISLCTNTGSLISMLPSVNNMFLQYCTGVENINNLPPNLSLFVLLSSHEVQWQWFQSKSKVSTLQMHLTKEVKNEDVQGKNFLLSSFLMNMSNLSELWLNGSALKFLAAGDLTKFHQLSYKLAKIRLKHLEFNDFDQVSCAICLLKSSPNLEKLELIQASSVSNDRIEEHDLSHDAMIAESDLKLNCLRSAKLESFTGLKAELALVKLILSHSPVLQRIEIQSKKGMTADKALTFLTQLTRFRRASVESEIIYTR